MTSRFTGVAEFGEPFLRGRHVLVAGATGGIGEGMTRALLALGATVVAPGRDGGRLRLLADYAGDTGPGVLPTHVIDVSDPDSTAVGAELARSTAGSTAPCSPSATGDRPAAPPPTA
ncbi:hypothetical protein ACWDCB_05940 [Streptomyces sp. NPDC001178]